jgi:heat shock protein HtpX
MKWPKRIFLFVLVNVLVLATISIVLSVLGVRPYLDARGINYGALAIFSLVWGFGGALISLALSRAMAKSFMGVQLVDPERASGEGRWLVDTVYRLSRKAGLETMPEVGVFQSPELNAFATGPTRSRALVAVSTGLLNRMDKDQVEGVIGHEVAHIANGDMVTMTLLQGVINAFVIFFARIAAFFVTNAMRGNDDRDRGSNYFLQSMITFAFEMLLSFLGMFVVAWFSRYREFRADEGGARLAGKGRMIGALAALKKNYELPAGMANDEPASIAAFKISSRKRPGGLVALLSTHPPLEDRIRALETKPIV